MAVIEEIAIGYEQVLAALDQLDVEELAGVVDRASSLLKKAIAKGVPSKKKVTGAIPSQLEQNHEWVRYVLGDARLNGWESFEMRSTKTDKTTGEKVVEVVTMTGSVEREDGVNVFADTGKEMSQGHAMCYSKLLKDRNDALYQTFVENYSTQVSSGPKKTVKTVTKTSADKEREKEEKEAKKRAEKEAKEAEKAEKEAKKKAEKEAKEAEKKAKEAEKAKPVTKEKLRSVGILVPVKRERVPSPAPAPAPAPGEEEAVMPALEPLPATKALKVLKKVVKPARPEVDPFNAGESGQDTWEWKGVQYVRDSDNYVWLWNDDAGEFGEFQGRYNYAKDVIEECEKPILAVDEDLGA